MRAVAPLRTPKLPFSLTIYYGRRRLLTLAPSLVLDRATSPYRRLSATLLLASKAPIQLEVGDGVALTTRAALLAPKVPRRRIAGFDADIAIFDVPVGTAEFSALEPTLRTQKILSLDFDRFAHLEPALALARAGTLACTEVDALFRAVVMAITGEAPCPRPLDPRMGVAFAAIDELPLDQLSIPILSKSLHVSSSRLRHLFQEQIGCSVTHYARWVAVWKAVLLWKQGKPFTELAHAVGFYDLAHLDHAFIETFGVNPSAVIDPKFVRLIRCS